MVDRTYIANTTSIDADWLNSQNDFFNTVFNGATSKTNALNAIDGLRTLNNVGTGSGTIARDQTPVGTFNLKTLNAGLNIQISNASDEITISSDAAAIFSTVALMIASTELSAGDTAVTLGYLSAGDGGDNTFLVRTVTGATADGGSLIKGVGDASIEFVALFSGDIVRGQQFGADGTGSGADLTAQTNAVSYALTSSSILDLTVSNVAVTTITMPTQVASLQAGVDALSTWLLKTDGIFDLVIDTAHQPLTGITISNGNFSNIRISSVDSLVTVHSSFTDKIIFATNAVAPTLNCLIDLDSNGAFAAYDLSENSSGRILTGAGAKNGTGRGLYVNNASNCITDGAIFTGFQDAGLHVSRSSNAECANSNFSSCGLAGGSFGAVYASRNSRINGADLDVTDSGGVAIRSQRMSVISVPDCDASRATSYAALATLGGKIYSSTGTFVALNLVAEAVNCSNGGVISLPDSTFSSATSFAGVACEIRSAGTADINSSTWTGFAGIVVYANEAARVNARDITIGAGETGLLAEQGATINGRGCNITSMTSNGVRCLRGGTIVVNDGTVSGSTGDDLSSATGSTITAGSCTTTAGSPAVADTNFTAFNTIESNKGIIWN